MTRVKSNTYKRTTRVKKAVKKAAPATTPEIEMETPHLPSVPAERNLMQMYMNEVSKAPLLSPDEEHSLAIRVFEHKDREAFQKLIQANLRFVLKIAFEYARYGAKVLDLVQEGNMGLLKAVQDFNPYKDVRLTTYAV